MGRPLATEPMPPQGDEEESPTAGDGPAPLAIRLFGGWEVRVHGVEPAPLRSRSERWLLALLALRHDRESDRRWLAETLWPDSGAESASFNLRRGLSELRRLLGREAERLLSPTPRTIRLDLAGASCDVLRFDGAASRGDRASLEEAVALYRGPLLEGCPHDWALQERAARQQAYLNALEQLAARASAENAHAAAARYVRLALAVDPLRESLHAALMEALAAAGDHAAAFQVYRDLRLLLHREVNGAPSAETTALFERLCARAGIGSHAAERGHHQAVPFGTHGTGGGNLPFLLTSLVGREGAVREVCARLRSGRLVTLTGPGGIGKTRLGIEAARGSAAAFVGRVCFVELAPVSDGGVVAGVVAGAVSAALGQRLKPKEEVLEQLTGVLRGQAALLVLDNCEHLIAAAAGLAETLLRSCPELHILATSREPLGITGEVVWRVPPLDVPQTGAAPEEGAAEAPSSRLFLERAQEALPGLSPDRGELQAVAQICRALEGLPLAIELAAARVRVLSVQQIAERLTRAGVPEGPGEEPASSLEVLGAGGRAAPARHQTLRGALEWSYRLLSPSEQALFRQLSVFAGGFTLEAVAQVAASDADGEAVLDRLSRLVDQSLVERAPDPGRFRLLETVREFAVERSWAAGERTGLRDRHLAWCAGLAERAAALHSEGAGLLRAELDNCRAALRWSWRQPVSAEPGGRTDWTGERRAVMGLRLATLLFPVWAVHPLLTEGRETLRRSLEAAGERGAPETRAAARDTAGRLAFPQGDYLGARAQLEEALRIYRELGDRAGEASALDHLGLVMSRQGDYPAAPPLLERALDLYRELGDLHGEISVLDTLAFVKREGGDAAAAQALLEQAVAVARRTGDRPRETLSLHNLGYVADARGENEAALALFEQALEIARQVGEPEQEARCLCSLSIAARKLALLDRAGAAIEEALRINRHIGARAGEAWNLRVWGDLELARGNFPGARRLLEESLAAERDVDCLSGQVWDLVALARTTRELNDANAARRYHREALELGLTVGMSRALVLAVESCAALLGEGGRREPAVRLLAAARALRQSMEAPLSKPDHEAQEGLLARYRAGLGDASFADAWERGGQLGLEGAVAEALANLQDREPEPGSRAAGCRGAGVERE